MESKDILYSKGKNDECYTLPYGVEPILKYIPEGAVVWCPFDTIESEFVKQISKTNKVVYTHIDAGFDFLTYEPDFHFDVIISNPPFSNKRKFFERAFYFGKPFALIMTAAWVNDSAPVDIYLNAGKDMQLLMFDKRMKFMNNGEVQKKITFKSMYYCCDLLPNQIILEKLKGV